MVEIALGWLLLLLFGSFLLSSLPTSNVATE